MLRFLDTLRIEQYDLVGTSHGGAVAMMMGAAAPERVQRLVLVAPVHPWSGRGHWRLRMLASGLGRATFRLASPYLAPWNGYVLARLFGDPRRITPGTLEAYAAPVRIQGTQEHLLASIRTWNEDVKELERALPKIAQLPTLLVWGSRDTAVPLESAERLQTQFARAELAILPGVGHLPYEEAPDEFNLLVGRFLSRVVSP